MPGPYDHLSGLPSAYDRTVAFPNWTGVVMREDRFSQGAEINEVQSILKARGTRVGDLVAKDGDRIEGADIILNVGAETVALAPGRIYIKGDVRTVAAANLIDVPMTGDVRIGVRMVSAVITEVEEPALLGLEPGTEGEGEQGAARQVETVAWGFAGDGEEGDLYPVYFLKDGVVIDQTPPAQLSGVQSIVAAYDRDAHGNYVVKGMGVSALGLIAGAQHFSIAEGVANIMGFKRTRYTALRHIEPETPTTQQVNSEPHTFADGGTGTAVITLNRAPKSTLLAAIITKEKTVTVTKGLSNTQDSLPDTSIQSIVSVVQGGTTYVPTTDYLLTADKVNWAPGGAEPAASSTYSVTYRYLEAVTPTAQTATTISLAGGVTGTSVFLTYTFKLPRVDLLCLDEAGLAVYIKGVSSLRPKAPIAPRTLLVLARIVNDWINKPEVTNAEIRSIPYDELWMYVYRLVQIVDLVALERLRRDIDNREPVAKKGMFVDPWVDDRYRDEGAVQTAAIFSTFMTLAIDPAFHRPVMTGPICLDYTSEIILEQGLVTSCRLVNPYQNFDPLPAEMSINPATDYWTETDSNWLSPITREFRIPRGSTATTAAIMAESGASEQEVRAIMLTGGTLRGNESVVNVVNSQLEFLRQIDVTFTVRGLNPGETISALTFDGLNVLPATPVVANGSGIATGTFTIPANVTAGAKLILCETNTGRRAQSHFVGQGVVEITNLQGTSVRVTLYADPLAQTFSMIEKRHVSGFDVRFCGKGDNAVPCILQVRSVENGIPTGLVLAEKYINMATVVVNTWHEVLLDFPLFLNDDREYCIVILTDDPQHSLATAKVGAQDAATGINVAGQPYAIGVMLSSSNAMTWTPHQDEDLAFRIKAAVFNPLMKTVNLGSFSVTNMSDVQVRATVDLPTEAADFYFELVRADNSVVVLLPGRGHAFDAFITETVQLRAVLIGSAKISPILYPGVLMIVGTLRTSGTYISKAFTLGTAIRMSAFIKAFLPAGSALTVEMDAADDNWVAVPQFASETLDFLWNEREYRKTPYTSDAGRVRLTLTGTPAARPMLSDFRAVAI